LYRTIRNNLFAFLPFKRKIRGIFPRFRRVPPKKFRGRKNAGIRFFEYLRFSWLFAV